jgi:DNA-binding response OmpR family regulator
MATVLVVDDLAIDRQLVTEFLKADSELAIQQANDGMEALAWMEHSVPDLVVTDLMMPHVGGLQLVRTVREKYPLVPVILMTSQGSEEIAVQALHQGAASYVPKRRLGQDLLDTVRSVLAMSARQRGRNRLLGCLARSDSSFVLRNDATLFEPLITYLQEGVSQLGLCDETDCTRVGVALAEALSNALYHGNLAMDSRLRGEDDEAYHAMVHQRAGQEPYCHRRIHVHASMSRDEALFVVRDEGQGFDPDALPDPTDPANLEKASGRGILLMRAFMDSVIFNSVGNSVTLVKRSGAERDAPRKEAA